jgi:H+/Cl- antiporter ClcA
VRAAALAVAVGVANALVFLGFEWVTKEGSDWLWNDVAGSDDVRWRVVPLAIAGSLALSLALRLARQRRVKQIETDPVDAPPEQGRTTAGTVVTTLAIGAVSLVGGASLGPEAPLTAASKALGELFGKALVAASIGALLVAFFGSPLPVVIPLALLHKRKALTATSALAVLLAGAASIATLLLVGGHVNGYGGIPADEHFDLGDMAVAAAFGACGTLAAAWLKRADERFGRRTRRLDGRLHWAVSAALFGAGLGLLYVLGGESVQFSGSEGTTALLHEHAGDGTLALLGLAAVKLLATGWCLACGYRGGPVFPSIYVGVAISLALGSWAEPGATIGAIVGILTALTNPFFGAVAVLALLPPKLCLVGLAGAAGAVAVKRARSPRADDAASPTGWGS